LNKPAGLSTTAPPIAGATLETAARAYLNPDDPTSAYLGLVHRLDRPVSGVILMAKTKRDARRLSGQFERRRVRKEYWAIVEVRDPSAALPPPGAEATWEDWLCREDTGLGRVQTCLPGTPRGQSARTRVRREAADRLPEGLAWLRLWPETGRMHQLRVQSSARGLPIVGDGLYGSTRPLEGGIALHAHALTVDHPALNRPITLTAPPPPSWAAQGLNLPEVMPEGEAP